MSDGERLKAFWKRWNHKPDDTQEFLRFRTRVDGVLHEAWTNYIELSDYSRKKFALVSGTEYLYGGLDDIAYYRTILCETLQKASTLFPIIEAIQFVLWTLEDANRPQRLEDICCQLNSVFEISPNVPVRVVYHNNVATLYPSGAQLLDEVVIEENLQWLENYPQVAKTFENALKIYLRKDPTHYREMLDNLRVCVEQMLRIALNNDKSLENQQEEFLRWLKAHDAHSQITNMYRDLLFGRFSQYQNDAVKHNEDKYTPAEVEFVLYLTGTFLRFIQRVSEQPVSSVAKTP